MDSHDDEQARRTERQAMTPPLNGQRRASMRAVADRAGVAMSSVSRVLSGHPDVSLAMRERVLEAVTALDYKPDLLAQSMRRRESLSVGFVVGDISNPVVAHIVKGAETTLSEAGYSMLLTNSLVDADLDQRNVVLLEQRRVDGLILLPVAEDHRPTIEALERVEFPTVVIERELPYGIGASQVLSDHRSGLLPAVEHLLDLGHRRIGLLVGQPVRPSRERRAALEEAFARRGLPATYEVRDGKYSVEHGAQATRELLDITDDPLTALIAGGSQIMIGSLQVISERGLELGRDLSFIGCDDVEVASLYRPPVAVVARDIEALGHEAAKLVLRRMHGTQVGPERVTLPTQFIPRTSCGPIPVAG